MDFSINFDGKKEEVDLKDKDIFSLLSEVQYIEFSKEINKNKFDQRIADLIVGSDKDFTLYSSSSSNKDFRIEYKTSSFQPIPLFSIPFELLCLEFEGNSINLKLRLVNNKIRNECMLNFCYQFPDSDFHSSSGKINWFGRKNMGWKGKWVNVSGKRLTINPCFSE
jgi:hypothetical protein